jgi:hypothetical protein
MKCPSRLEIRKYYVFMIIDSMGFLGQKAVFHVKVLALSVL